MNSNRLILEQIELGPLANYIYLLGCPDTKEAAVVDPAWDVAAVLAAAKRSDMKIRHVLLTHGHPDHMNGLQAVLDETDAAVHIHKDEMD
ncbi:MAG: MBL fold metallo-hydrolase, partial [Acidobacteriota bacterium]